MRPIMQQHHLTVYGWIFEQFPNISIQAEAPE